MPRVAISGEPGEVFVNHTGKTLWQLRCQFSNSCGLCIRFANQISSWWPVPFHRSCSCQNAMIPPGTAAAPFLDFMAEIRALAPAQQRRVIGKALWRLVDGGVVKYEDAVTKARVRTLAEVVAREKLSVKDMVAAGVSTSRAEAAWLASRGPEADALAAERAAMVAILRGHGMTDAQIRAALAKELTRRVGIAGVVTKPTEPAPPPAAPTFGLSKAKVSHPDYTEAEVLAGAKSVLNRKVSLADIATLAGAPDDADVGVSVIGTIRGDVLDVRYSGHGYRAHRVFFQANDRAIIKNESFIVWESRQGQGIGTRVFGRQVEHASKLGIAEIQTLAVKGPEFNGYYTWPRFGYDAPIPAKRLKQLPTSLKGATRVSDLMQTEGGRSWWKEHGMGIEATYDLAEGSLSRRIWAGYLEEKARTAE